MVDKIIYDKLIKCLNNVNNNNGFIYTIL